MGMLLINPYVLQKEIEVLFVVTLILKWTRPSPINQRNFLHGIQYMSRVGTIYILVRGAYWSGLDGYR